MNNKICTKCNRLKSILEFHKDKSKKDGFHGICKNCRCENQQDYIKINKEKHYKSVKQYYINNPWMQSFKAIQYRCNNINAIDYKYYG